MADSASYCGIKFTVEGHEEAQSAFDRITAAARGAGEAFSGISEQGSSIWSELSDKLGPVATNFEHVLGIMGPTNIALAEVGAVAIATGTSMFELGEKATAAGAAIAKTALIMNENAAAVSDMQFAWKSAGGDLDSLNGLVFMFEQRIENSSDKVKKGFKDLGLSLDDFASATTTDKILAVSNAMRNAGDDTNVSAAAFEVFGRGAKQNMSELMGPLAEMAARSKEIGATWSDVDAKAAREFEMSLSALKTQTDTTWTTLGKDFEPISQGFVYGWDRMKLAVVNVAFAFDQTITGFGYFKAAWDTFISGHQDDLPKVQSSTKGLIDSDKEMYGLAAKGLSDYAAHAAGAAELDADVKAKMELSAKHLKEELAEQDKITNKALEALNKYNDVWGEIAQMGSSWVETLAMMRPETRGLADDLLTAGLSQEKVAIATGATIEQVKALVEMRKFMADADRQYAELDKELAREHLEQIRLVADEDKKAHDARMKAIDESNKATAKSVTDMMAMERQHSDFVISRSQTTEQAQIAAIQRTYTEEVTKAQAAGIINQRYYDDLKQKAIDAEEAVREQHDLTFQAIVKMQNDLTTGWQQSFASTLVNTGSFGQAFESIWKTVKTDVENIFASMLTSIISGFLQPLLDNVRNVASSVSSMLMGALTGNDGGGGFGGFVSGSMSGSPTSGLGGGILATTLANSGLFGSAAIGGGASLAGASEFSASTVYGVGTSAGGGVGGAIGGALSSAGSALGTAAAFLATNPIGWAIDAGIGALALWNHFSGPSDQELAGRSAYNQWKSDVWAGLSPAQQSEAQGAGWPDAKDAGAMVWMRTMYTNLGRSDPEKSAENFMQNIFGSLTKGYSGVVSSIQDVASFANEGFAPSPTLAIVGDRPGGEYILHPETLSRLSKDAYNAGGASQDRLVDAITGLHRTTLQMFQQMNRTLKSMPTMQRDALARGGAF
jgi:hypothetical protein